MKIVLDGLYADTVEFAVMVKDITARQAIKAWLGQHEKTQYWLAAKLGVAQSLVSEVLAGIRPPTDEFVTGVKKHTGIDLTEFERVA